MTPVYLPLITSAQGYLSFSCFFVHRLTDTKTVVLATRMYTLNFILSLALVFGRLASSWVPPTPVHKRNGEQHEAKDKRGAVASESTVCSNIGINLIKDGGNAADAVSGQTIAQDGTWA